LLTLGCSTAIFTTSILMSGLMVSCENYTFNTRITRRNPEGTPKETRRRAGGESKELLMWFEGFLLMKFLFIDVICFSIQFVRASQITRSDEIITSRYKFFSLLSKDSPEVTDYILMILFYSSWLTLMRFLRCTRNDNGNVIASKGRAWQSVC
jgi:hypothetical protein